MHYTLKRLKWITGRSTCHFQRHTSNESILTTSIHYTPVYMKRKWTKTIDKNHEQKKQNKRSSLTYSPQSTAEQETTNKKKCKTSISHTLYHLNEKKIPFLSVVNSICLRCVYFCTNHKMWPNFNVIIRMKGSTSICFV